MLLHVYPSSFRRRHARDLRETFAMRMDELHGAFGIVLGIPMALGDVIPNAIAAHFERSETALLEPIADSVIRDSRAPMVLPSGIALLRVPPNCCRRIEIVVSDFDGIREIFAMRSTISARLKCWSESPFPTRITQATTWAWCCSGRRTSSGDRRGSATDGFRSIGSESP
ncbi:MAG: hypothetical protein ABI852_05615 [Gemmatimonadaceae bacterium]